MIEHEINKVFTRLPDSIKDKTIYKMLSNNRGQGHIGSLMKKTMDYVDELYQRKENVTGVATGFHDLDIMTAGLQKSDLIIIAGRPSMGKTALATSIMSHAAVVDRRPCAIFSIEMSSEQVSQRLLCSFAHVNAHKVRTGFLSQLDWPKLVDAAQKLSGAPLFIDDTSGISLRKLKGKCRRLKREHDIQLIIVDYIQLMRGVGWPKNRQQEISEISRSLKTLAVELDVPIIGISQLSRRPEYRLDHRPRLSDLRGSGSIEDDADIVLLLFREEYYNPTEENNGLAEVVVAKQRSGPVGRIVLNFAKEYTTFFNLKRDAEYDGF